MDYNPSAVEQAKHLSQAGKPVLLVLLARHDCGDTKAFLPTLERMKQAFGDSLLIQEHNGSHRNRDTNSPALKAALNQLAYDKTPGDSGGDQRGHFPSGALYVNGEEVYRLPSDSILATISPPTLANQIIQHAKVDIDKHLLFGRADIPLV